MSAATSINDRTIQRADSPYKQFCKRLTPQTKKPRRKTGLFQLPSYYAATTAVFGTMLT